MNRDLIDKYQTTLDTTPQQGNPITDWLAQLPFFIDGDEAQPHCICEEIGVLWKSEGDRTIGS